jgi:ubiquinone/menaquinone biosynthesis C-methylase UbiE
MLCEISSNTWNTLACSFCGKALSGKTSGAECPGCGLEYRYTDAGALDLRLQKTRHYDLQFELGTPLATNTGLRIEPLEANRTPEVDFAGMSVPHHMTRELMSYFPKAKSPSSLMLDLACGDAVHKGLCEAAGFEWVGADYAPSSKAAILADAHALPFQDESFECILSVAAIHLFRYPLVMMQEAHRVLKPGGVFLGTVAFLEPFHDDGFYHHTHLGAINSLQFGGFTVQKLAPSEEWSVLTAQASMALFPKMPKWMSRSIVYPVQLLHKLWWQLGSVITRHPHASKDVRIRNTTAAFAFVASKTGLNGTSTRDPSH